MRGASNLIIISQRSESGSDGYALSPSAFRLISDHPFHSQFRLSHNNGKPA